MTKADFRTLFRNGQRSVTEPGPTPNPWSINYLLIYSIFDNLPPICNYVTRVSTLVVKQETATDMNLQFRKLKSNKVHVLITSKIK